MVRSGIALVLLAVSVGSGCTPRCQETCTKILDCGLESTRVARDECVLACQQQQRLYDDWEDTTKQQALKEHRRCIEQSTCDEIAEGVCYDPELFVIDGPTDG